jgi:hypothetical protein
MLTHKELKRRALKRADVKAEYECLGEEFALLDELLKARATSPPGGTLPESRRHRRQKPS